MIASQVVLSDRGSTAESMTKMDHHKYRVKISELEKDLSSMKTKLSLLEMKRGRSREKSPPISDQVKKRLTIKSRSKNGSNDRYIDNLKDLNLENMDTMNILATKTRKSDYHRDSILCSSPIVSRFSTKKRVNSAGKSKEPSRTDSRKKTNRRNATFDHEDNEVALKKKNKDILMYLKEIERLQKENDGLRGNHKDNTRLKMYKLKLENRKLKEILKILTGRSKVKNPLDPQVIEQMKHLKS